MSDTFADVNPALLATDTANFQAGASESLLNRGANFFGAAMMSGVASIYNTFANYVGDEKLDVAKWITENDEQMGASYAANKEAADVTGFLVTSLVPGGVGLKGLQLAKAGTVLGPFSRALGYAESRQAHYVQQGLRELALEGGTVFAGINRNKLAAMSWGVADNMLQVAAMETAIAATMKASPLLEDKEWKDIFGHTLVSMAVFGPIGGGIGAIGINSIFKTATKDISKAMNEYTAIERYKGALTEGDQALGMLASMLRLPQVGRNLDLEYQLNGVKYLQEGLSTKKAFESARESAEARARLSVEELMTKMADGDVEIGQAFSSRVFKIIDDGKSAGKSTDDIIESLADHLANVGKLRRVTADSVNADKGIFYATEKADFSSVKTVEDLIAAMRTRAPTKDGQKAYRVNGHFNDAKIGIISEEADVAGSAFTRYAAVQEAWNDGADVVLAGARLRINPKSKLFQETQDTVVSARSFFNARTGAWTPVAFPTFADLASTSRPLAIIGDKFDIVAGTQAARRMKQIDDFPLDQMDTVDASARYAWAGARGKDGGFALTVLPRQISESDLPLLERMAQHGIDGDVTLVAADGGKRSVASIGDIQQFLMQKKLEMLEGFLARNPKGEDITSLAIKLNAEPSWVQKAIENGFQSVPEMQKGMSIPLAESLRPQNMEVAWDYAAAITASVSKLAPAARNEALAKMLKAEKQGAELRQSSMFPTDQMFPESANNVIYGQLGFGYRVKVAKDQLEAASAAVLGAEDAAKLLDISPETVRLIADQTGAGAGSFKFSNADYGDQLRLWAQYTGQQVSLIAKKWVNGTLDEMKSVSTAIFEDKTAAAELGILTNALRLNQGKYYIDPENGHRLVIREAFKKRADGVLAVDEELLSELAQSGTKVTYEITSPAVAEFLATSTIANARRIDKQKVLMTARGFNHNYDPRAVYIPPVDTGRYPFFAFVRQREGVIGGSSEVTMITARTAADLKKQTDLLPEQYQAIFSDNIKAFHKAKGDYDYALSIKEPTIDSSLQKRGVLGDFFPEVRAENVLEDWINWHRNAETRLVRNAVETRYGQVFEELRATGAQYEEVATSKVSGVLKKFRSQSENPFDDYVKTALDISKRSEYTLLHEANEFVEALGKTAYRGFADNFAKAREGTVSWQEANALSEKYGIAGPYSADNLAAFYTANKPADKSLVKEFVSKANMALVNFTLRLDFANSLVNIISTPILLGTELSSIRGLVAKDSELAGKLAQLRSVPVPGSNGAMAVPSNTAIIGAAIKSFFSDDKAALLARYRNIGAVKDMLSKYHEMIDDFSFKPWEAGHTLAAKANAGIDKAAKFTGGEFAEEFTRFVSADVMRQLTEPLVQARKMSVAEQDAYISVFVNRVQGNYLSSQRPIIFQGVLGSAVSLFQTYQFNLLQQLFRHVENGDKKTLAVMAGLQGSLYGMSGIPFFEAVNNTLIGNSKLNPGHKDAYSTAPQILGKELGDWLMYGTASAFPVWSSQSPALYTRGDVNPRHISIIPITPLDVPAVDGSIRFVSNLFNMGAKMMTGGGLTASLLEGLEHNGINRPLAGMAQLAQGYSTTSKGSLISANNDFFSIATMSRAIGAKPMDESLALNSMFRINAYKAADLEKIEALGSVVKTKLRAGGTLSSQELEEFQLKAAKAGMRIENYAEAMQRWSRDANASVINKLADQHKTSYSQRLMEILGGERPRDFRNTPRPVETDATAAALPPPALMQ